MQIKTTSWHYWLASKWDTYVPTNLCPYFWSVVMGLVKVAILAAGICFLAVVAVHVVIAIVAIAVMPLVLFFYTVTGLVFPPWLNVSQGDPSLLGIAAVIGSLFYGIGGVIALLAYRKNKRQNSPPREPSFIAAVVKSKLSRTCVPLEFVTPQDNDQNYT